MTTANRPSSTMSSPSEVVQQSQGVSRLVRRIHMYLGLFLAPWLLMYALSTLAMGHRPFVQSFYRTDKPKNIVERKLDYSRTFDPDITAQQKALVILKDLGLEGRHTVSNPRDGAPLVITRHHALFHRRILLDPKAATVSIEREEFRGLNFLERMHRRRGFQDPYAVEDTWAFTVDLSVLTLVFWGFSGIWMWWGIRQARFWGGVCLVFGIALFTVFLVLI